MLEFTWDPELKSYAGDYKEGARYEIWDWKKGLKITTIKKESVGATQVFFGNKQNQSWLVSFFKYQKDYDYPAAFRPKGALSFFDTKTGDTNWRVYGNAYQTVGFPIAQLSPTQIVSQSTIYEYPAKHIRPLRMQGEHVRLLGVVPGQSQKMIVATKRGAELWDYAKQKRLHRWAEIKDVNQIYFSPDLHFFATQKYAEHLYEFYRFDKRWIM